MEVGGSEGRVEGGARASTWETGCRGEAKEEVCKGVSHTENGHVAQLAEEEDTGQRATERQRKEPGPDNRLTVLVNTGPNAGALLAPRVTDPEFGAVHLP